MIADLFHWGHAIHLENAKKLGDVLIVGITDGYIVKDYKRLPIMDCIERIKVVRRIKGVDMVIPQFEKFPLENLKLMHKLFPKDKLICVHGNDWDRKGFKEIIKYLDTIKGEFTQLPYTESVSTTQIIRRIKDGD